MSTNTINCKIRENENSACAFKTEEKIENHIKREYRNFVSVATLRQ